MNNIVLDVMFANVHDRPSVDIDFSGRTVELVLGNLLLPIANPRYGKLLVGLDFIVNITAIPTFWPTSRRKEQCTASNDANSLVAPVVAMSVRGPTAISMPYGNTGLSLPTGLSDPQRCNPVQFTQLHI